MAQQLMTNALEEDALHHLLAEMLETPSHPVHITGVLDKYGLAGHVSIFLDRLLHENLAKQIAPMHSYFVMQLTPHGLAVARHEGGYKGFLAAQKKAILAKEEQEIATAKAAVDGVRANWWAVRASLIGIGVSALFSIISLIQSAGTAAELKKAQQEIVRLKQQLKLLPKQ